ncbi:MAG: polyphosphate kinase 2 family protein [Chloroflexota bacterium]|jgi:PPK2 family polyphosphate:nucleotide phosphotransferase
MSNLHRLEPGRAIRLEDITTAGKQLAPDRQAAEKEFKALRDELIELQRRHYAADRDKLLIVFQAMDAGGKDGTIRRVFRGVNPQGVQVTSFKVPSKKELAHDFLWRIHQAVPPKGMIGVFNRSHYEDVLVVRVNNIVPESVWRPRYAQINNFEKMLVETGTIILKFYLHISKKEQRERFQARIDDPTKNWKFSFDDLEKRKLWPDYMAAYEEMLNQTTTAWAPWHVIPADQKWYRNLAVTRTIVSTLKELDPKYPKPEQDLTDVTVE